MFLPAVSKDLLYFRVGDLEIYETLPEDNN